MSKVMFKNVSRNFARKCEKECFVWIKWTRNYSWEL